MCLPETEKQTFVAESLWLGVPICRQSIFGERSVYGSKTHLFIVRDPPLERGKIH